MKKTLFVLTMLLPMQAISTEQDSVYKWGNWENGIQPAAGPVTRVTPPAVKKPDVNFRPNENSALLRVARVVVPTPPVVSPPPALTPVAVPAPAVVPEAPQVANIVIVTSNTPTTPIDLF